MFVKVPQGPKGQIRKVTVITKRAKPAKGQSVGSPLERKTIDDLPFELSDSALEDPMVQQYGRTGRLVECDPPTKADERLRAEREAKKAAARGRHAMPKPELGKPLGGGGGGDEVVA